GVDGPAVNAPAATSASVFAAAPAATFDLPIGFAAAGSSGLGIAGSALIGGSAASAPADPSSPVPGYPGGGGQAPPPGVPSGSAGAGSTSAGGGGVALSAVADGIALPTCALGGATSASMDDRIPASPVADHDTSPD
ncbi:hypothetical protein N136_04770, partial [Leifsonia aquatica ATCC 14665]